MISAESITVQVAGALDRCGIPYMLSGSFASDLHRRMVPQTWHLLSELRSQIDE